MWWRRVVRGLVFGCLALVSPSLFAQQFIGFVETPLDTERVSGMVLVRGFAIDQQQVARVDLFVDEQFQHSANLNIPRIDIIEAYPNYEGIHTRRPGFQTSFLSNRFPDGAHTIHVQILTSDGRSFEVGRRTVVVNNTINQSPFGAVDIPDTSSVFDANGAFPVVGWALDVDGVDRVEVQIDNLTMQGAIYGDPRPDVANAFPDLPTALFSGFIANVDTTRVEDGVHSLTVRVTDRRGLSRVIGRRTIQIFNSQHNLRPFGVIDEPLRDSVLYGNNCGVVPPPVIISPQPPPVNPASHITPVRGWALDLGTRADVGRVAYVELLIDGVQWFSTDQCGYSQAFNAYTNCYGLPRFDVARYYPTYSDSPRSGFMFTLDVGALIARGVRPGHHTLKVRVGDQEQTFADIPNSSGIPVFFTCFEDNRDFASLGYIDFPETQDFIKGTVNFFGWALDQNLGGVRNVEIYVDGTLLGTATYGFPRTDVRAAHPTIANSLNSGWRFTLDTTKLSDARHRLTVRVIDATGNRTEIGSKDFYVDNPD